MKVLATIDLAAERATAKALIDSSAEAFRLNFITPGDGQAMAYREKFNEAILFMQDQQVSEADIPHIVAEVGITGQTKYEVVQVVLNMHDMWKHVSAGIERARLAAKEAVDEATNPAAISEATEIDWDALLQQLLSP